MKHLALFLALTCGASAASAEDLAYVNAALRAWLQAIEADAPYLLVDRGAGELRLMHGRALLRRVPLAADSLGTQPLVQSSLAARLRRYRLATLGAAWCPARLTGSRIWLPMPRLPVPCISQADC